MLKGKAVRKGAGVDLSPAFWSLELEPTGAPQPHAEELQNPAQHGFCPKQLAYPTCKPKSDSSIMGQPWECPGRRAISKNEKQDLSPLS